MSPIASVRVVAAFVALATISCHGANDALEDGASWTTREVPASHRAFARDYQHTELFGDRNDSHGWRSITRYTLSADTTDGKTGCHVTDWVPGTWVVENGTLVVTTESASSGSREVTECPDGTQARTVMPRPAHFVRATSTFQLEGRTLRIDHAFGEGIQPPLVLAREN